MKGEALWLLQTHCGRWLINKHLTNPLRNLGRLWTNSRDAPYSISDTESGAGSFALRFQVEKYVWPEPRLQLGHHDSSSLLPLHIHTHLHPTTLLLHTSARAPTWIHASALAWGVDDGWLKSYWGIKVESIKLCASAWSREETGGTVGAAGGPLMSRSVQGTFTISSLPIDGDRCQ